MTSCEKCWAQAGINVGITGNTSKEYNIDRDPEESIYDYEDRLVRHFCGGDACLNRTSNGAPWAMPCTHQSGHAGECEFICTKMFFEMKILP